MVVVATIKSASLIRIFRTLSALLLAGTSAALLLLAGLLVQVLAALLLTGLRIVLLLLVGIVLLSHRVLLTGWPPWS